MVSIGHLHCSSLSNRVVAESEHLIGQKMLKTSALSLDPT